MKWNKIKNISKTEVDDTYDIAMKSPNNNYIANDIVVHNSNFVQRIIREVKPDNFEQLAAISALLRPGPLMMGMDKEFARRKNGLPDEDGNVWSPEDIPMKLRNILEPTLGILVYQEQIMQIAKAVGGYSVAETNQLRKSLVKLAKQSANDPQFQKQINDYRSKFVESAKTLENLGSEEEANRMFDLMYNFSAYGFNKSHSVSYTYISFYEYWLKAYYDPEFNVSLLNNTSLKKEKNGENIISLYLTEIMKKGYTVKRPNINKSDEYFKLNSDTEIQWGLGWVKNLTEKSIFEITSNRYLNGEYISLKDFFDRVGNKALNKRVVDALVWSGALDDFIEGKIKNRFDLYNYIFTELKKGKFDPIEGNEEDEIDQEIEFITLSFRELEKFAEIRKHWENNTGTSMDYLFTVEDEGSYNVVGIVDKIENKKTKTGKDYVRITLRDETKIMRMIYAWPWKCKGWDSLRKGMFVQASLTNDGKFVNIVGWTLINESEKQKRIEEERVTEEKREDEERKQAEEEKRKKFLEKFKSIYTKWSSQFNVKRIIDDVMKQPVLHVSSEYGDWTVVVYAFSPDKGIPRKDLVRMKDFDAIYIVSDEGEYLFEMSVFQSKMTKVKAQSRIKYPSIPHDIEKQLSEQVIENKLS